MHFSLPTQIYYYADSIYATAGVKQNDIQYVTVGTGAVNVFMTIAAVGILRSLDLYNILSAKERRSWSQQSVVWSCQQEALLLNSEFVLSGLHCGGLGATAAPPLWFWDLLCSLCAAYCRSQLPGIFLKASVWSHTLNMLLCCSLVVQYTNKWSEGCHVLSLGPWVQDICDWVIGYYKLIICLFAVMLL